MNYALTALLLTCASLVGAAALLAGVTQSLRGFDVPLTSYF